MKKFLSFLLFGLSSCAFHSSWAGIEYVYTFNIDSSIHGNDYVKVSKIIFDRGLQDLVKCNMYVNGKKVRDQIVLHSGTSGNDSGLIHCWPTFPNKTGVELIEYGHVTVTTPRETLEIYGLPFKYDTYKNHGVRCPISFNQDNKGKLRYYKGTC